MLNITHASLSFGSQILCEQLDFTLNNGEIGMLMAPSGAGKSTLLKWIAGLSVDGLHATGSIALNHCDVSNLPAEKRRIGFLFQQPYLFPHLNVAENISFGMPASASASLARREDKIASLLDAADMAGYEARDSETLSGGQQARIALLRVVASEPQALLLDEPFASLDDVQRERMLVLLSSYISELDIPVLMVSHDPRDRNLSIAQPVRTLQLS